MKANGGGGKKLKAACEEGLSNGFGTFPLNYPADRFLHYGSDRFRIALQFTVSPKAAAGVSCSARPGLADAYLSA